MRLFPILLSLLLGVVFASLGQSNIPELREKLTSVKGEDKLMVLSDLAWYYSFVNPDSSLYFAQSEEKLALELKDPEGQMEAYGNLGRAYYVKENFPKALQYYEQATEKGQMLKIDVKVASYLNNIAIVYRNLGDSRKAIQYYTDALTLYDKVDEQAKKANTLNNMGVLYKNLGELAQATEYYWQALAIYEETREFKNMGNTFSNIGTVQLLENKYKEALETFQKSAIYHREFKNNKGLADVMVNIAELYNKQEKIAKGFAYLDSARLLYESVSNLSGLAEVKSSRAKLAMKIRRFDMAIGEASEALKITEEIGLANLQKECLELLAHAYEGQGNTDLAYSFYKKFHVLSDSLSDAEVRKDVHNSQMRHEIASQNLKIDTLKKDKEIERMTKYGFMGGVVILGFVAFLFYNRYQLKQKANVELAYKNSEILQQKEEITAQRDNIELQNQQIGEQRDELEAQANQLEKTNKKIEKAYLHIQDSIRYAKRIQQAVVGNPEAIIESFKSAFVLFSPKDVVSGDFYWFYQTGKTKYVICADCTGHGVPGAMMTAIGNTLLNEIIKVKKIISPAQILAELDKKVQQTLRQSNKGSQQDGMDITILKITSDSGKATFAGAKNPLLLVRQGEPMLIKGSKFSVGGYLTQKDKVFEEQEVSLQPADRLYIYTDGFQDQFGGEKGRKYLSKRFRQLLVDSSFQPMAEQQKLLALELKIWKGDKDQTDDICLIGVEV